MLGRYGSRDLRADHTGTGEVAEQSHSVSERICRLVDAEAFPWSLVSESLARPRIQFLGDYIALALSDREHVGILGDVLTNQAIRVFNRSAFHE